jgi:hypothetical protein
LLGGKERLAGYVLTTNYLFHFREWGQMDYIERRRPTGADANIREYFDHLARQPSEIGTKEAYQLATQWLAVIDVDVAALERKFRHSISHPKTDKAVRVESAGGVSRRTRTVPRFTITWGERGNPHLAEWMSYAAQVTVLGPTKELERIAVEDTSLFRRPRIEIPGAAVLQELPSESFTNLWLKRELSVTNVFELLRTSTAYQAVILRRMLEEANWTLRQLEFPADAQLRAEDLIESIVVPPQFGFRGIIRSKDSFFQFDEKGKIKFIFHTPLRRTGQSLDDYYEEMSNRSMLVDSNNVVSLAATWLRGIQVDMEAINRISKPAVTRYVFTNRAGRKQPSHIWWVSWWDHAAEKPLLSVQVDGTTKNPDRIEVFDTTYSRRKGIGTPEADELMTIPDSHPQSDPLQPHRNVLADRESK